MHQDCSSGWSLGLILMAGIAIEGDLPNQVYCEDCKMLYGTVYVAHDGFSSAEGGDFAVQHIHVCCLAVARVI